MGVVDSAMVGRIGPTELAAVGFGGIWLWTLFSILYGTASGIQTFVSQADGAGEVRGWVGRLKVPTFAEWQAAVESESASFGAEIAASKDKSLERTGESDETEVPF